MVVVLEFLWNETRTLTLIHCYDLILGISIFVYNFILEILYTFWKKKSKDQDCDCYRRSLFSVTTNGIQEWHLQHTLRFTAGESLMPVSSLFIRLPRINTMAAALKAWRWPAEKHLSLQHTVSYLELVSVFFNVIHSVPVTYTVHSNLFESLGLNKQNENHYQRQNKHTKDTQKKNAMRTQVRGVRQYLKCLTWLTSQKGYFVENIWKRMLTLPQAHHWHENSCAPQHNEAEERKKRATGCATVGRTNLHVSQVCFETVGAGSQQHIINAETNRCATWIWDLKRCDTYFSNYFVLGPEI